jgi:hypothetical protein
VLTLGAFEREGRIRQRALVLLAGRIGGAIGDLVTEQPATGHFRQMRQYGLAVTIKLRVILRLERGQRLLQAREFRE